MVHILWKIKGVPLTSRTEGCIISDGNEVLPWETKTAFKLMTSAVQAGVISFFC